MNALKATVARDLGVLPAEVNICTSTYDDHAATADDPNVDRTDAVGKAEITRPDGKSSTMGFVATHIQGSHEFYSSEEIRSAEANTKDNGIVTTIRIIDSQGEIDRDESKRSSDPVAAEKIRSAVARSCKGPNIM